MPEAGINWYNNDHKLKTSKIGVKGSINDSCLLDISKIMEISKSKVAVPSGFSFLQTDDTLNAGN